MSRNKGSELHDITLMWHGETDMAIQVSENGRDKTWLPKSQIEYKRLQGEIVEVTLPQWLYEKKEFST